MQDWFAGVWAEFASAAVWRRKCVGRTKRKGRKEQRKDERNEGRKVGRKEWREEGKKGGRKEERKGASDEVMKEGRTEGTKEGMERKQGVTGREWNEECLIAVYYNVFRTTHYWLGERFKEIWVEWLLILASCRKTGGKGNLGILWRSPGGNYATLRLLIHYFIVEPCHQNFGQH